MYNTVDMFGGLNIPLDGNNKSPFFPPRNPPTRKSLKRRWSATTISQSQTHRPFVDQTYSSSTTAKDSTVGKIPDDLDDIPFDSFFADSSLSQIDLYLDSSNFDDLWNFSIDEDKQDKQEDQQGDKSGNQDQDVSHSVHPTASVELHKSVHLDMQKIPYVKEKAAVRPKRRSERVFLRSINFKEPFKPKPARFTYGKQLKLIKRSAAKFEREQKRHLSTQNDAITDAATVNDDIDRTCLEKNENDNIPSSVVNKDCPIQSRDRHQTSKSKLESDEQVEDQPSQGQKRRLSFETGQCNLGESTSAPTKEDNKSASPQYKSNEASPQEVVPYPSPRLEALISPEQSQQYNSLVRKYIDRHVSSMSRKEALQYLTSKREHHRRNLGKLSQMIKEREVLRNRSPKKDPN